jgi:hypothetical protein
MIFVTVQRIVSISLKWLICNVIYPRIELHNQVRGGRLPVPLINEAHSELDGQTKISDDDLVGGKLKDVRKALNCSWVVIRLACEALLNKVPQDTPRLPFAKSIVRRIRRETGFSEQQILDWINRNVE